MTQESGAENGRAGLLIQTKRAKLSESPSIPLRWTLGEGDDKTLGSLRATDKSASVTTSES